MRRNFNEHDELEENELVTLQNEDETSKDLSIYSKLKEIKAGLSEEETIRIRLCKKDENGKSFPQIDKLTEDEIEPHEIGLKHGSGEYKVYMSWTEQGKSKVSNIGFKLGKHYDNLKRERDSERLSPLISTTSSQSSDSFLQFILAQQQQQMERFERIQVEERERREREERDRRQSRENMFTFLAPLLAPVIAKFMDRPQATMIQNDSTAEKMLTMLLPTILDNKQNGAREMLSLFREGMEMGKELAPNQDNEKSWIDIVETIVQTAPAILASALPPKVIQQQIESNPQVQDIVNSPDKFKILVDKLISTHGIEKAKEILKSSGHLEKAISAGYIV
jgi:hypothetical protein